MDTAVELSHTTTFDSFACAPRNILKSTLRGAFPLPPRQDYDADDAWSAAAAGRRRRGRGRGGGSSAACASTSAAAAGPSQQDETQPYARHGGDKLRSLWKVSRPVRSTGACSSMDDAHEDEGSSTDSSGGSGGPRSDSDDSEDLNMPSQRRPPARGKKRERDGAAAAGQSKSGDFATWKVPSPGFADLPRATYRCTVRSKSSWPEEDCSDMTRPKTIHVCAQSLCSRVHTPRLPKTRSSLRTVRHCMTSTSNACPGRRLCKPRS